MADEEMNLVAWLSERIEVRRTLADQVHTLDCDRVSGSLIENLDDSCDCGQPAAVRDSCDAHGVLLAGHGPANGPDRWDDDGHPVMGIVCAERRRVAPELLILVRDAAAHVPNSDAPAVPMDAIVSDDLQAVVDLALVSGYRANVAKAIDTTIFGGRTGEVLGILDVSEGGTRAVVGPLNPMWTEGSEPKLSPFVVRSIDDAFTFDAPDEPLGYRW